jgi:serine/threonine protein kinase
MAAGDPLIGIQLANFRIERLLGTGGMANVYYGWDVKLDRPVAVKTIDARYRDNPLYAERFVREAQLISAWSHPNILKIYYAGQEQDLYYYVMEYIHGQDLGHIIKQHQQAGQLMPQSEVARIAMAVGDALDYAHQRGVVHRDVKPSNVLISEEGRVAVTDFGLALDVERGSLGEVFGSPNYIAPEQARNSAQAVPQSDIYSLGVILYEMLTGSVPFHDSSPAALALQHMTLEPPPPRQQNPKLGRAIESVLLKALRKDPAERYQTGYEMAEDLGAAIYGVESTAPLPIGYETDVPFTQPLPPGYERGVAATQPLPVQKEEANPIKEKLIPNVEDAGPLPASNKRSRALFWMGMGCLLPIVLASIFLVMEIVSAVSRSHSSIARTPAATQPTGARSAPVSGGGPAGHTAATQPPAAGAVAGTVIKNKFVMYYDDRSFYFQNLSGEDRNIFPIAFERLDKNGNPANRFDGRLWGDFYPTLRAGYCLVIEIINDKGHLDPPECANRYLVVRTPVPNADTIFWTKVDGSKEFRVLWNDQEIGRCEIAKGFCEVYLP